MFKAFLSILMLTVLSLANGPLLKTGQVTSYDGSGNVVKDGSVKDDGYYHNGAARSYGRSGDIVIDNATGLQWQDDVDSVERKWEDSGSFPAAEYCNTLPLGGYADWRLPSIHELLTLVDASQYNPSLVEGVFDHVSLSNYYWSSTAAANGTSNAWIVTYYYGGSFYGSKDTAYYVRCVRGEQFEFSHFSRNNETNIVTDALTSLQWQDDYAAISTESNWITAIDYCEDTLMLGGYSDWRLPNRNELLSIIDYSRDDLAIYSVFTNRSSGYYWSSTTSANITNGAWVVDFDKGFWASGTKNDGDFTVRCVRGGQLESSNFNPSILMYLLN